MGAYELLVEGRGLPWLLTRWAQQAPDKIFLIWVPFSQSHGASNKEQQWTYSEFELAVRQAAAGLSARGVKKSQRVLIHLENCPELLISWFACAYLGAVAVLTNTRSAKRDINYFCEHAEVVAAITQPQFSQMVTSAASDLSFIAVTETNAGQDAEEIAVAAGTVTTFPFDKLMEKEPLQTLRDPEPMLDLSIQFTSGTTSRPKAVVWTHANMVFSAQQSARNYRLHHDDICQLFLPLFHMYALSPTLMSSLWVGATVILQRRFSASNFWPAALRHRATWCAQIPFSCQALEKHAVPEHHFRFWTTAIAWPEVEARFGVKTLGSWGMTETVACPIVTDIDHGGSYGCLGRVTPGYEVAIRRQDGSSCGRGESGRLYLRGVRGITIFKEYLKNPQANAESFDKDGWFDTGDLIRIDKHGDLYFKEREKDMIKVGGENVSPAEVESVIMETGWIKECAVVAQQHAMLDEVAVAFIIPKDDAPANFEEKLLAYCKEQLADFKVIRRVYCLDDFPRSVNYKIAKPVLRQGLPILEG